MRLKSARLFHADLHANYHRYSHLFVNLVAQLSHGLPNMTTASTIAISSRLAAYNPYSADFPQLCDRLVTASLLFTFIETFNSAFL